jgi:hypothetical protein
MEDGVLNVSSDVTTAEPSTKQGKVIEIDISHVSDIAHADASTKAHTDNEFYGHSISSRSTNVSKGVKVILVDLTQHDDEEQKHVVQECIVELTQFDSTQQCPCNHNCEPPKAMKKLETSKTFSTVSSEFSSIECSENKNPNVAMENKPIEESSHPTNIKEGINLSNDDSCFMLKKKCVFPNED